MTGYEDIKVLIENIHSATVSAIKNDGHPQTRVIGDVQKAEPGYYAGTGCIGCKLCYSVCPQKCIDISQKPVVIDQKHCLHCGRCAEICPKRTIKKRG